MVNFKLNPEHPAPLYRVANVVAMRGEDWKPLPYPIHVKAMQDIRDGVLLLDGDDPHKDTKIPYLGFEIKKVEEVVEEEQEEEEIGILSGGLKEVKEKIGYLTDEETLNTLLEEEKSGKNRKSIIECINNKLE